MSQNIRAKLSTKRVLYEIPVFLTATLLNRFFVRSNIFEAKVVLCLY